MLDSIYALLRNRRLLDARQSEDDERLFGGDRPLKIPFWDCFGWYCVYRIRAGAGVSVKLPWVVPPDSQR